MKYNRLMFESLNDKAEKLGATVRLQTRIIKRKVAYNKMLDEQLDAERAKVKMLIDTVFKMALDASARVDDENLRNLWIESWFSEYIDIDVLEHIKAGIR